MGPIFSSLTRARFSPGRVIAPKKARIVQQQQLKKVSADEQRVGMKSQCCEPQFPPLCGGYGNYLATNGPPKAGIGAQKSVHMLAAFAKLSSLISQFSSVAQSCPTLGDPMNHSTPGLPVQLPEFTQTHVHRVGDAIQPSHPLSSPSPAASPSQHQGLFQ